MAQNIQPADDSKSDKFHLGVGAWFSVLFNEVSTLGYKLEVTRQNNRLLFGVGMEYSEQSLSSHEIVVQDFSTTTMVTKHMQFVHVGLFGQYFPFSSNSIDPYVSLQAGSLFAGNEFAFPLSASIGSEFRIELDNGSSLNPFAQYGYQYVVRPISDLNQDGFKLTIGLRYVFN